MLGQSRILTGPSAVVTKTSRPELEKHIPFRLPLPPDMTSFDSMSHLLSIMRTSNANTWSSIVPTIIPMPLGCHVNDHPFRSSFVSAAAAPLLTVVTPPGTLISHSLTRLSPAPVLASNASCVGQKLTFSSTPPEFLSSVVDVSFGLSGFHILMCAPTLVAITLPVGDQESERMLGRRGLFGRPDSE